MKYYIIVTEWDYPTESGRDIIDDFNTIEMARRVAKEEVDKECNNFLERNICIKGEIIKNNEIIGYQVYTKDGRYFRSRIIEINDSEIL